MNLTVRAGRIEQRLAIVPDLRLPSGADHHDEGAVPGFALPVVESPAERGSLAAIQRHMRIAAVPPQRPD